MLDRYINISHCHSDLGHLSWGSVWYLLLKIFLVNFVDKFKICSDPKILETADEDKDCWFNNYKSKHIESLKDVFK